MRRTTRLAGSCAAALALAGALVLADVTPGGLAMVLIGALAGLLATVATAKVNPTAVPGKDAGRYGVMHSGGLGRQMRCHDQSRSKGDWRFGMVFSDFDKACRYPRGN